MRAAGATCVFAALVRAEAWRLEGVMEARVGQWASHAVAPGRRRGRVRDAMATATTAPPSQESASMRTNSSNTEKNTYLWEHAICASSQVTGLGWASVWLSRERSADRVVKRAAARL